MEKKIVELKLEDLEIVSGGVAYSIPAATVAKQPDYGKLASQPMSWNPQQPVTVSSPLVIH